MKNMFEKFDKPENQLKETNENINNKQKEFNKAFEKKPETIGSSNTIENSSKMTPEYMQFLKDGWETQKYKVEQSEAGAYILRSGEKLLLGDYSDEDITVLTLAGNLGASIVGADLPMDIRDLSYDIKHWGEDKFFVTRLAIDTIALVPVVGALENLKYSDEVLSIAKNSDVVADALDSTKDAVKNLDKSIDSLQDVAKKYVHVDTLNEALEGQKHNKTGVEFVKKQLEYSDGTLIEGVFAKFDSIVDIQLPQELYKASFDTQKKYIMKELQKLVNVGDSKFLEKMSQDDLLDIKEGVFPEGLVLHHNEAEGLMQLVDAAIHSATAHTGGMSLWGKGY